MKMLVFVRSEPLGNGNLTGDTMGLVAGFVINIQIGYPVVPSQEVRLGYDDSGCRVPSQTVCGSCLV